VDGNEREQDGGALCSAHVPRRRLVAAFSSFTSLRKTPHRPDAVPLGAFGDSLGQAKGVGWLMERSKGGETVRDSVSADTSAIGHPAPLARALWMKW
jgi:hypothetical protein